MTGVRTGNAEAQGKLCAFFGKVPLVLQKKTDSFRVNILSCSYCFMTSAGKGRRVPEIAGRRLL